VQAVHSALHEGVETIMKPLNNRVIVKVEKIIKKDKVFNQETGKMEKVETVEMPDVGVVTHGNDLVKKGDKVKFQRYGALEISSTRKAFVICVDSEDLYAKI